MKIYYAHIDSFSDDFYFKALSSAVPREKAAAIGKITHRVTSRESMLAWAIVVYAYHEVYGFDAPLPRLEFYENGKPRFAQSEFCFNISHSEGLVCVAASMIETGIDVQAFRHGSDAVKRRVLSENELERVTNSENGDEIFIDIWSRKESYLKFTGLGISQELRSLDFSPFLDKSDFVYQGLTYKCMEFENCRLTICTENAEEVEFHQFIEALAESMFL